jgi:hypothetical protein
MSCDRYRRMMYLYRAGELSEREQVELHRHLQTCERCSAERERIERAAASVQRLREFRPTPRDPDRLTANILASIAEPKRESFVDRLLEIMLTPAIRYASAVFVLAAVGSFIVQYYSTLDDVASLERRFEAGQRTQLVPDVAYSISGSALSRLPDRKGLTSVPLLKEYAGNNHSFTITQRRLSSLVPFSDLLSPAATSLLRSAGFDAKKIDAVISFLQKNATLSFTFSQQGR